MTSLKTRLRYMGNHSPARRCTRINPEAIAAGAEAAQRIARCGTSANQPKIRTRGRVDIATIIAQNAVRPRTAGVLTLNRQVQA